MEAPQQAPQPRSGGRDLTRTTFAVLFIGLLLGTSLWILRPFLGPTVWATMVVVATWPLLLRVQKVLWPTLRNTLILPGALVCTIPGAASEVMSPT